mgnify:CR=1 FL=1
MQNVSGDVQTVTARVTEYPVAYARSYGLTALLTSPDVPNCKARLYVSDADAAALRPGDEITADVKFRPSTLRYGEETDERAGRLPGGCAAVCAGAHARR